MISGIHICSACSKDINKNYKLMHSCNLSWLKVKVDLQVCNMVWYNNSSSSNKLILCSWQPTDSSKCSKNRNSNNLKYKGRNSLLLSPKFSNFLCINMVIRVVVVHSLHSNLLSKLLVIGKVVASVVAVLLVKVLVELVVVDLKVELVVTLEMNFLMILVLNKGSLL